MGTLSRTKKKNSIPNKLLDLITIVMLVITFIPQFRLFSWLNYAQLALGSGWLLIAFFSHPTFFLGGNKYFLKSLLCFTLMILIAFVFANGTIVNRMASMTLVPLYYWIYSYNSTYRGEKPNMRIVFISLIFITYTSIKTISELIINPYASRSMKTSVDSSIDLVSSGVSGYSLIYAVAIMVIIIVPLLLERKKLKFNMMKVSLLISLGVMFIYLIILSNYFTALVLSFIGIISLLSLYKNKRTILLLIPFCLSYLLFQKEINIAVVDTVMSFSQSGGRTHQRMAEIKKGIETGGHIQNVDSRSGVLELSLNQFSEHPIFGYIIESNNKFILTEIGQHSFILDTYAMYGFFIGSFCLWIMWLPFKSRIHKRNNYRLNIFSIITGLVFLGAISFNNLTPSMGYAAFFVFPTVFDYLKTNIYEKKEK